MSLLTAELGSELVAVRRDLHQDPEIAHQEHRTAGIVAGRLRELGLDNVRTGVGQTGVTALLRGARPGPVVLLRADMDALPLDEADRGQPYRSRRPGVHHACGHDGHVAILLAVASILRRERARVRGTVAFVFQPAEERVGGAEGMIRDGALDPKPDACFGLHLWNELPVGTVDARAGPIFANADAFAIALGSAGGHGAAPHQTSDPIAAAAYLVTTLQTLVAREVAPLEPAALTIGSIHGGTAPNVIPARVELQGTLRTFEAGTRERLLRRIQELTAGIAGTLRVSGAFSLTDGTPACVNDPALSGLVRAAAARLLGSDAVSDRVQTCGADDMSLFLQAAPGCYFLVGSANHERGLDSPHHSPAFDFDEGALAIGADVLAQVTLDYLAGADGGR
jgi:amidohydrolase